MDIDKSKESSSRLGRRPVKQGPRSLSSDQDRGVKTAPGRQRQRQKQTIQLRKQIKVGTWNVRSMIQTGKLQEFEMEMERMKIDICGVAEIRWNGQGHFTTANGHKMMFSGPITQGKNGVGIWVNKRIANSILGYEPVNERIISVKIRVKPRNVTVVQVYAPTTAGEEEEIEAFYEELAKTVNKTSKREIGMIMGDFNAKVGQKQDFSNTVGKYGLGKENERGEHLQDFCADHDMTLANTWFRQHPRRLYTWTSPDGKHRNQIDYIAIQQKWKHLIKSCKTYPGADCGTDHNVLVATLKLRFQKTKQLSVKRLNLEELAGNKRIKYEIEVTNRFQALEKEEEEKTPEEMWRNTKNILLETAEQEVGYIKAKRDGNRWISDETITIIEAKREAKPKDKILYKKLKAETQKRVRQDKKKQLENMCKDIEESNKKGNTRNLFSTVRTLTKDFKPRTQCIKSKTGENIIESKEIAERWKEYCEELYNTEKENAGKEGQQREEEEQQTPREPPPTYTEVEHAIKNTAKRKTAGLDGVPVELISEGGETVTKRIHRICEGIWETGDWPEDWTESVFIPIPKKGDQKECKNHRTIALVSHASKILLRIILERIRAKSETEIAEEQAGFRKGRGTRDQILNIRIIMQKAREHQQTIYMCFVDFKKAFDSVRHKEMWVTMINMGYPPHIVQLLTKLYKKQKGKVRVAGELSSSFRIKKGVRQGCVLSPYLFNIVAEMAMREALEDFEGGIAVGGRKISNLRYADDIVLLARSEEELQELVKRVENAGKKYGLMINTEKTKVMTSEGVKCEIVIGKDKIEQVARFTYLGSVITEDSECINETRTRLAKGAYLSASLKKVWKSHDININTKIRLWKALVWPVATYGFETLTLKKEDERRITAFEMKGLRQILRVKWIERKTNDWVMEKAGTEAQLLETIKKRKLTYFGHIMRKKGNCLEKEMIQGTTSGKRRKGRPRMMWMDNIKTWTGMTTEAIIRTANEREQWKRVVHDAAESRIENG